MTYRLAAQVLAAVWLAGCTSFGSVAPLVTDDNAIVDPLLIGTWLDSGSTMAVVIDEEDGQYRISIVEADGEGTRFGGRLGRVGSLMVLELIEQGPPSEAGEARGTSPSLYFPVLVDLLGSELGVRILDTDSLKRYFRDHPRSLDHFARGSLWGSSIIITAPTSKWRRFLESYARRPGVAHLLRLYRTPTARLEVVAGMAARQYHYDGAGECIHARHGRLDNERADTWRVRFATESSDSTIPTAMAIKTWTSPGGATRFMIDGQSVYRRDHWFHLSGAGAIRVTEADSVAALNLAGVDFSGDSVHIAVRCSPVTVLVPETSSPDSSGSGTQ